MDSLIQSALEEWGERPVTKLLEMDSLIQSAFYSPTPPLLFLCRYVNHDELRSFICTFATMGTKKNQLEHNKYLGMACLQEGSSKPETCVCNCLNLLLNPFFSSVQQSGPGAGIMEADDRQVTTVFTVQPSFLHGRWTNRVS